MAWPVRNRVCSAQISDRLSATIVNNRAYGLFDHLHEVDCFGFIMRPSDADVLCSYLGDGCTNSKTCQPDSTSPWAWPGDVCGRDPSSPPAMMRDDGRCIPGCGPQWCETNGLDWSRLRGKGPWRCAWQGLRGMLQNQAKCPWCYYNEVILNSSTYASRLPLAVEAFFVTERCRADDLDRVRKIRRAFLATFALGEEMAPVVSYLPPSSQATDWPRASYVLAAFEDVTDEMAHPSAAWAAKVALRTALVGCDRCWRINKGRTDDCSAVLGCHSDKCSFCTNTE